MSKFILLLRARHFSLFLMKIITLLLSIYIKNIEPDILIDIFSMVFIMIAFTDIIKLYDISRVTRMCRSQHWKLTAFLALLKSSFRATGPRKVCVKLSSLWFGSVAAELPQAAPGSFGNPWTPGLHLCRHNFFGEYSTVPNNIAQIKTFWSNNVDICW